MARQIIIFDTTLRDGEQAPGASLSRQEKLEIAQQLARMGVDVIEAGFPICSPEDFAAVQAVAQAVRGATICGLARSLHKDIEAAAEALKAAPQRRIHVFLATSKIHMQFKLKKAEAEIVRLAVDAVRYARQFTDDVEFSPEDASRTEPEFLLRVIEQVIDAGATTVNIPDTVGYAQPQEYGALISTLRNSVPNINKAIISVHCHNDLGLAVANSLAAVANGAGQVECTINGIGERAGNAAMEEIVMSLQVRGDVFGGARSRIKTADIYKTSRLVSKLTGFVVPPNKAIVGSNAFRHESGIHQDGVLKERRTYEIMRPEDVGFSGESLVLGKHSGRHALAARLQQMGFSLHDAELDSAFERFKQLADVKKEVFEEDLLSIVEEHLQGLPQVWQLAGFEFCGGNKQAPQATVTLRKAEQDYTQTACGDGPVDACYKAMDAIIKQQARLVDYSLQAVTSGKDAQGAVNIKLAFDAVEISGRGVSTDIVEASVKAYLNAVNRFLMRADVERNVEL